MIVYRPLQTLSALTFDLDDTLYDNAPVIRRTELESMNFLRGYHPLLAEVESGHFQQLRAELRQQDPEIYHDVTQWRWRAVHLGLTRLGLSDAEASQGADEAMAHFAQWRSRIEVPQETHDTLKALAARWPLVAVTNGNADPAAFGLSDYFECVLRSGPHGRAKPYEDMYHLAARQLNLPLHEILHVGDDLTTDVAGSVRCGMQSCWINLREGNLMKIRDARLLPHIEISRLASLTALL
ncbi:flavin mononucleotide phosphatase [Chimaeribacter arupi]|jgi:putative hydrolase of the HAD superfamily|uniref:Flavin mononucleotide phosphatase n=2 Tax=Yersiniaceae TaxID=1903411 RepID=A0A2N5EIS3_9GAMM|nr:MULTISPECIES: 5-amino-6-(5-phospho-D-ribitylamino)uracil phosphatase YigB [Yersiniaceae]MBS0971030.1 5-amino-6-(5-phospho-D-ribitylamino)uracil phosphatase YigB [Nissabacter archeti]MDV5141787.1 5-amino-6-(5-phospho-D-ribitylamino)uracil phosphatase YigB [Chimaeribacter arupi]PLR32300.1 flavin mononucleotide phosphatase [Chimaeribacter arupi]PLR43061.1 flavin mononucleotide phosphatase [Chimaeribacter arupi]PLR44987.1 flavin mononucleotide phosphatase [Chimaeribacter arupi]